MSAVNDSRGAPHYFVPQPSRHPALAALGLFLVALGASQWVNEQAWGRYAVLAGLLVVFSVLFQWFGDAIRENETGQYSRRIDASFRWSMGWFIFSEVMFFAAFFAALFWTRAHAVPNLGSPDNQLLWPGFEGVWPSDKAGATGSPAGTVAPFETMGPWPIPTLNTALLLSSGLTITLAHHALLGDRRAACVRWMWLTVALGVTFLGFQGYEYLHAYRELNLKLSSGVYGSTFYMLTGFHGFHVLLGTLMLTVITGRLMKGHFSRARHFGFEGVAWYWHFVDVVWLGLYLVVYWL